jgi:Ca2+-binding RTX toxin-like protein
VELGDGDDEVGTTRPGPAPIGGVIAFGGSGDDRLDGGAGSDVLDGGGGTDVLLGGDGFDALSDGDTDAGANADTLDGGAQLDTVSYARRAGPVRVQLGDALSDGAPGEGDVIRAVEGATGGAGADRLVGDGGINELAGGPGEDVLIGLGGEDEDGFGDRLRGGAGDDTLQGGDGPDDLRGERGTDLASCGRGADIVHEPKRGEWLERGCDAIRYSFGVAGEDSLLFRPHPRATTRTSARFAIGCPNRELLDGEASRCRGTLTLREASSGRRLIGRGVLAGRLGHAAAPVRVPLTPLGRRLARRAGGVDVTATIGGRGLPTRSWTFPLRAR